MTRTTDTLNTTTLSLLIGVIFLLAIGQVLFKFASANVKISEPRSFLTMWFCIALAVYGIATLGWVMVLARVPLSVAFPFYGLAFLLVPIMAKLFLNEPLRPQSLVGGGVILVGIAICSRGYLR